MTTAWIEGGRRLVRGGGVGSLAAILLAVSLGGAAASSAGLLRWSDGLLVDGLTLLFQQKTAADVPVVQIEMPAAGQPMPPDLWNAVFRKLEQAHPRLVVVIDPVGDQAMIARQAARVGAEIVAPSLILRGAGGIVRRQALKVERNGLSIPTVAGVVADRLELTQLDREFPVDFRLDPAALPLVSAEQVAGSGVDAKLIDGRVVLIGHALPPDSPAVTVSALANSGISPLRFHTYAVANLVSSNRLAEAGPVASFLLIVAATILTGLSLIRLGGTLSRWSEAGAYLLLVPVWIGAFAVGNVVLPYTAQVSAAAAYSLILRRRRARLRDHTVGSMVRVLATEVAEGPLAQGSKDDREHWARIVTMVTQLFDLRRMIFLEVIPGQQRIDEVAAHNCSLQDITEPRRDYRRYPYTMALEANGPVLLEREFLAQAEQDDAQYLAPMTFAGELLGFWAFTIDHARARRFEPQLGAVNEVIGQVAELLHQRRQSAEDSAHGLLMEQRLADALHEVQRKRALVEGILSSVYTAVIVYDLFGNVLFLSPGLRKLAACVSLDPEAMTALDFVSAITGLKVEAVRRMIRQLALGGERTLMSIPGAIGGRTFALSLSAVAQEDAANGQRGMVATALLCELIDVHEFRSGDRLRHSASSALGVALRHDLGTMTVAAGLLQDRRVVEDQRQQVVGLLDATLKRAAAELRDLHAAVESEEQDPAAGLYPVNPVSLIQDVLSSMRDELESCGVTVDLDCPRFVSLTRAGANEFRSGIRGIVQLLKQDLRTGGALTIRVVQEKQWVSILLSNDGYGLPDDSWQTVWSSGEDGASPEFLAVRSFARAVAGWGGEWRAQSRVGEGFSFSIRLRCC